MSNILTGILNEANPYRISEPEREYGAPAQSRPRMGPQEPEDVPDDLPPEDPFKQDPAKLAKVEYSKDEGEAPNGKRYNMIMTVTGPAHSVRSEIDMFNKHHWGAKKIVDMKTIEAKTPNGPSQYTVYIVDNHKYGMWTPFKGEKPVGEPLVFKESQSGISASDLADILYNRLEMRYPDIVSRYGHDVVGNVVMDVADFHEGAEELGTSDIGGMIRQIVNKLENYNVDESKEQDYGPDYQAMVNRVGQLAKQGERKTVYDPVKRVYKTVPVNPPKQQGMAEGSEWETRHDEFTTVGDRATPEQINKIVSALGVAAKQASSKRGFLNKIVGRQSNGDLARMAQVAETLAKSIQRNSNANPGTDERKELGQHLVYAVSLLKRMNGQQGVAEARTDKNLTEPTSYIQVKQLIDKMDKGGKKRIANALRKNLGITTQDVAEEYELAGVDVAYELGRKAYKQGMTIRDNPYSATKEARKYDEWEKGLERGKWDAIEARQFRSSIKEQGVDEGWSQKYKNSINCSHPKGFSQKAHCAGKKKHNESVMMEMVCEDCGMCETHGDHTKDKLDELKCWSGFHRVAGTKAGFPGSCAKNKTNEEGVAEGSSDDFYAMALQKYPQLKQVDREIVINALNNAYEDYLMHYGYEGIGPDEESSMIDHAVKGLKKGVAEEKCPHCSGPMFSELMINEKKDACYYKVKSRYKVWPSAYASGALVKCRNKGASNWGNSTKNEGSILEGINRADESLHDWFNKEKWVRMDTKGNIKGPCAKEPGEGKPKCLPQSKAHSLGKKGRASAAQRKRREDPNPDRSGKAINVDTKKN
jgi:hypothetical protein